MPSMTRTDHSTTRTDHTATSQDWPEHDQDWPQRDQNWPQHDQDWPEHDQDWPQHDQDWPQHDQDWPEHDQDWPQDGIIHCRYCASALVASPQRKHAGTPGTMANMTKLILSGIVPSGSPTKRLHTLPRQLDSPFTTKIVVILDPFLPDGHRKHSKFPMLSWCVFSRKKHYFTMLQCCC